MTTCSLLMYIATTLLLVQGCIIKKDDPKTHAMRRETFNAGPIFLEPQNAAASRSVSHDFVYCNTSEQSITLNVQSNCRCTDAKPQKSTLLPNERTRFTLTYPLVYKRGITREAALVFTNGNQVLPIMYELLADVYPRIIIVPEYEGVFNLRPGTSIDSTIRFIVYQDADSPEWPLVVESHCKNLSVQHLSRPNSRPEKAARRTDWTCGIRLSPPILSMASSSISPQAISAGQLFVSHGRSASEYQVRWRHQLPIRVRPPQLFLQQPVSTAKETCRRHGFELRSKEPFTVCSVELHAKGNSPIILKTAQTVYQAIHQIEITFPDGLQFDYHTDVVLQFTTSHPGAPVLSVPVYSF